VSSIPAPSGTASYRRDSRAGRRYGRSSPGGSPRLMGGRNKYRATCPRVARSSAAIGFPTNTSNPGRRGRIPGTGARTPAAARARTRCSESGRNRSWDSRSPGNEARLVRQPTSRPRAGAGTVLRTPPGRSPNGPVADGRGGCGRIASVCIPRQQRGGRFPGSIKKVQRGWSRGRRCSTPLSRDQTKPGV